jgi:hypothetical protein
MAYSAPGMALSEDTPSHPVSQDVHLFFAHPLNSIAVDLSVNVFPGCGGVPWPAGEVSFIHINFSL